MDILKARQELLLGKSIYDMNLRVVDYGRVSTDKDDQLNSLENQIRYFDDFVSNVKSWTHVASYADEGISGTQVYKREQFLKMVEDARLGKIDLILTKEVSRFARNTIDSIKYTQLLLSYGVIVYFISDGINTIQPDSEFRLTIMASMAQDEVRKLSERVKFGVKRSIKDGKVGGSGLYGYIKNDCKLIVNDEEAKVVNMIFSLYVSGNYGLKRIGEMLAEKGYYTRNGKVFSDATLKKMITNPKYKGWYTAGLTEVQDYKTHKKVARPKEEWICYKDETGAVPQIISDELWTRANELFMKRKSIWNKNVLNKEFYLQNRKYTSKLFCMEHNTTFIRCASGKRKENPVWQCNEFLRHGIKGCLTPRLYEKHLDEIFTSIFEKFIDNKDEILNSIVNDYIKIIKDTSSVQDINALKQKITEQEELKDKLLDMSLRNIISEDDFKTKNEKISEVISSYKQKLIKMELDEGSEDYFKTIANKIRDFLKPKISVKENIGRFFDIFVDKVFVSKINNDRKHINLKVIFNFNREDEEVEINMNKNNNDNNSDLTSTLDKIKKMVNHPDNYTRTSFEDNFFRQKYLSIHSKIA